MHLGGFGRRLWGRQSRLKPRSRMVWDDFCLVFRGHKPKSKISKNVDFFGGELILSRVGAMINRTKVEQNAMLEVLKRKKRTLWRPTIAS